MELRATSGGDHDSGHLHAVRFYENKASLARTVADFLGEGFPLSQPALVIASPEHRDAIFGELRTRDVDVEALQQAGELLVLDARAVLATFMVDGMPDATLFTEHVTAALDRLFRGRAGCTIRAYGEMVDLLWQDGLTAAAVRLEVLWNQLALTHTFSLLCGYAMGSFYKAAGMTEICAQHSHVVSADSALADRAGAPIN
jgi:hypothetical protein